MEATKVGVLITALIVLVGVGMYFINNYSGAVVGSGPQCDETENLFNTNSTGDLESLQSIFKFGKTKTRGSASGPWQEQFETCSNSALTERYCLPDGTATSEAVTCVNGCTGPMSAGKCKLPACSDSDNGQNYQTTGITTGLMLTDSQAVGVPPVKQNIKTYTDYCSGDPFNTLNEFYCYSLGAGNYEVKKATTNCAQCQNGRCCSTEVCDWINNDCDSQLDEGCFSCSDLDVANEPTFSGKVEITYSANGGSFTGFDKCIGTSAVNETTCKGGGLPPYQGSQFNVNALSYFVGSVLKNCPEGTVCVDNNGPDEPGAKCVAGQADGLEKVDSGGDAETVEETAQSQQSS